MRESNVSNPLTNRASKTMTTSVYERSTLNCTTVIPLLSSLNHLIYMTSTSVQTREAIVKDGGLEQLIHILNSTKVTDVRSGWKWSMAYQCVVNIGVRGNEYIRKRVVEANTIPIVINILETFLAALEHIKTDKEKAVLSNAVAAASLGKPPPPRSCLQEIEDPMESENAPVPSEPPRTYEGTVIEISPAGLPIIRSNPLTSTFSFGRYSGENHTTPYLFSFSQNVNSDSSRFGQPRPNSSYLPFNNDQYFNTTHFLPEEEDMDDDDEMGSETRTPPSWMEQVLYREEDILLSLQLLAYLSKYPALRQKLHVGYAPINVFRLVEHFTTRAHANEVQYWSGIIMRNACRKDEDRGGLRQCAYMSCGKWESFPREFAKCRRCRKAKYCSKSCQSRAWTDGHRYWCVERSQDGITEAATVDTNQTSGIIAPTAFTALETPAAGLHPLEMSTAQEEVEDP